MSELITGPPCLSANSPFEDALWQHLADLNCSANEHVKGFCRDCDPEPLHKYRVLLRRGLALIEITSFWVDSDHYHELRRLLKRHLRKTNQLRDSDVFLLQHGFYLRRMKVNQRRGMHKLHQLMLEQRNDYDSRAKAWFSRDEYLRDQEKLSRLRERFSAVEGSSEKALRKKTLNILDKKMTRCLSYGKSRPINRDSRKLHRLRIVCKKLRYGWECG